jgi:hypothetical protein
MRYPGRRYHQRHVLIEWSSVEGLPAKSVGHTHFYRRPSRARRIAGLSGFLILIQSRTAPTVRAS